MKRLFIFSLVLLLSFSFSFAQEVITETELTDKKENIEFESILKDAEFHPGYPYITRSKKHCFLGWWTLKFENGAVVRAISRDDQDATIFEPKDVWWIGKKYVVIKMPSYREIRLLEKDPEKKAENSIS